jgi:glyoxylase-like metal-dependent hydrolase (beta-lactamase superfamily II)
MTVSVKSFFHSETGTASYLVVDSSGHHAVIIDSALDLDLPSGKVAASIADAQLAFAKEHGITIQWILETHAHADHLSSAAYLQKKTKAKIAVGKGIISVQKNFSHLFHQHTVTDDKASGFDRLLTEQDCLTFGESEIKILATPGHTDDSISYLIEDNVFVGDTLFMPDGGTARCDFPGGSAEKLWTSIEKIYQLPDDTKIWVCHDYQPNGREVLVQTTVASSKANNIHINQTTNKIDYITMRNERDKTLPVPRLLYPSLQVNLNAGTLPEPGENGVRFLTIPLTENY